MKPNKYLGMLAISGLLIGCGSGDEDGTEYEPIAYNGKTEAYTLTGNEDDTLATSMEFAYLGLNSKESGYMVYEDFEASVGVMIDTLNEYSQLIESEVGSDAIPPTSLEGNCESPGSVNVGGRYNDFSIAASSYCETNGIDAVVISGEATFKIVNDITTLEFENFSIDVDDVYSSINGRVIIDESGDTYVISVAATITENERMDSVNMTATCPTEQPCSYDVVYKGDDGKTYKIEGLKRLGDEWNMVVSGFVYLPDFGKLEMGAWNVSICEDWTIGGGQLAARDDLENQYTLIYSNCGVDPNPNFQSFDEIPN